MTTVTVCTPDGRSDAYETATGWHVEEGELHIVGPRGTGNVAAYPKGGWASVRKDEVTAKFDVAMTGVCVDPRDYARALRERNRAYGFDQRLA